MQLHYFLQAYASCVGNGCYCCHLDNAARTSGCSICFITDFIHILKPSCRPNKQLAGIQQAVLRTTGAAQCVSPLTWNYILQSSCRPNKQLAGIQEAVLRTTDAALCANH
jgi:hypothetical protein